MVDGSRRSGECLFRPRSDSHDDTRKASSPLNAVILYTTDDGRSQIRLRTKDAAVWLSQREMAELFDVSTDNVGLHLKNLFLDGELVENSVA